MKPMIFARRVNTKAEKCKLKNQVVWVTEVALLIENVYWKGHIYNFHTHSLSQKLYSNKQASSLNWTNAIAFKLVFIPLLTDRGPFSTQSWSYLCKYKSKKTWYRERWKAGGEGDTEDEVVRWHHRLNGHEFEQAPGDGEDRHAAVSHHAVSQTQLGDWTAKQQQHHCLIRAYHV